MFEIEYQKLFAIIKEYSGLNLNLEHEFYLENYINNRLKELNINLSKYTLILQTDNNELTNLINEACINETYFFREQIQFDFLNSTYFPEHANEDLLIWSAACSTGEESLSLLSMCKKFNINPMILSSDIDKSALEKFKSGVYTKKSFRNDGTKYHQLIKNICTFEDETYKILPEELCRIQKVYFNLAKDKKIPVPSNSVDLIFLRNVFIYFDEDVKKRILEKMYKALKPNGLLFFSVNEIPSIDEKTIPGFVKENKDSVYYLKKIM